MLWTLVLQAPVSMYWSGEPFPSPRDPPDPGTEPMSPLSSVLQAESLLNEPSGKPIYMHIYTYISVYVYEEVMATHSSILAWRIAWTEEPGRLQSMGLQRVSQDWVTKHTHTHTHTHNICLSYCFKNPLLILNPGQMFWSIHFCDIKISWMKSPQMLDLKTPSF